jgi:hypothetical protein
MGTETPADYRAVLKCRRCGALRYVPSLAEKFTYWICLPMQKCGTMNVWR